MDAGIEPPLIQRDFEIATAYRVRGTPSAAYVRRNGSLDGPVAAGAGAIEALVEGRHPGVAPTAAESEAPEPQQAPGAAPEAAPAPDQTHRLAAAPPTVLGADGDTGQPVPAADPAGRWTVLIAVGARSAGCDQILRVAERAQARIAPLSSALTRTTPDLKQSA